MVISQLEKGFACKKIYFFWVLKENESFFFSEHIFFWKQESMCLEVYGSSRKGFDLCFSSYSFLSIFFSNSFKFFQKVQERLMAANQM